MMIKEIKKRNELIKQSLALLKKMDMSNGCCICKLEDKYLLHSSNCDYAILIPKLEAVIA